MAENPPTSINIESGKQDNDSKLDSKTESHKITVVTPHKRIRFFPSGNTTLLHKVPKTSSRKEKNKKIYQDIEEDILIHSDYLSATRLIPRLWVQYQGEAHGKFKRKCTTGKSDVPTRIG